MLRNIEGRCRRREWPSSTKRYMSTWTDLLTRNFDSMFSSLNKSQDVALADSTSKSRTNSFVSSVPFRLPTAQTNFDSLARILHTTPPDPPESSATKFRMNSPVRTSQSLTVPSSEDVITKRLLNWRHVTADWCLFGPEKPIQTFTCVYLKIITLALILALLASAKQYEPKKKQKNRMSTSPKPLIRIIF